MKINDNLRHRLANIAAGDTHFEECRRLTAVPVDTSAQSGRHWRRAAKLYGMAADFYHRAGLGLRAIAAWQGAAACHEALGMHADAERCRLKAVSIPVYYGEE